MLVKLVGFDVVYFVLLWHVVFIHLPLSTAYTWSFPRSSCTSAWSASLHVPSLPLPPTQLLKLLIIPSPLLIVLSLLLLVPSPLLPVASPSSALTYHLQLAGRLFKTTTTYSASWALCLSLRCGAYSTFFSVNYWRRAGVVSSFFKQYPHRGEMYIGYIFKRAVEQ
jgi:hypothetical protein